MFTFSAALASDRDERWRLLDAIVTSAFPRVDGPAGVDASELDRAEARLGLRLPTSLRTWYLRYGARHDVWSLHDTLLRPERFAIDDGVLTFAIENQCVVRWGVRAADLSQADPPIVMTDPSSEAWFQEASSMSEFALQFALMNVKWSSALEHRANCELSDVALGVVAAHFRRVPLEDLHWPPAPTRFFVGEEVLLETDGDTWLWVSARSARALADVRALLSAAGVRAEWLELS